MANIKEMERGKEGLGKDCFEGPSARNPVRIKLNQQGFSQSALHFQFSSAYANGNPRHDLCRRSVGGCRETGRFMRPVRIFGNIVIQA